ncbi:MAG: hypothetical protein ABIC04_02250 [Nanoarchaeota archaeon]
MKKLWVYGTKERIKKLQQLITIPHDWELIVADAKNPFVSLAKDDVEGAVLFADNTTQVIKGIHKVGQLNLDHVIIPKGGKISRWTSQIHDLFLPKKPKPTPVKKVYAAQIMPHLIQRLKKPVEELAKGGLPIMPEIHIISKTGLIRIRITTSTLACSPINWIFENYGWDVPEDRLAEVEEHLPTCNRCKGVWFEAEWGCETVIACLADHIGERLPKLKSKIIDAHLADCRACGTEASYLSLPKEKTDPLIQIEDQDGSKACPH